MRPIRSLFRPLLGERGQSVVEAIIAVAILGVAAQSAALVISTLAKQNVANRDRTMATEKAVQMLEELRALVLTNSITISSLQYNYSDPVCNTCSPAYPYYYYTLTTKSDIFSPSGTTPDATAAANAHSGNPVRASGYAFVRHIDIIGNTTDPNVRTIYVRVYKAANNLGSASTLSASAAVPGAPPLAEVYGEVHSLGTNVPPSQVLDMYFIAIESVPGWWSRTSELIPLMQSSVVSLQAMNPGLVVRSHWIRTMSYGRDLEYTPELNNETIVANTAGAFQEAYVYPGLIDYDNVGTNDYYYLPSWFLGRIDVGGWLPGSAGYPTDAAQNEYYPIADQYNHAMRYADEANLYSVISQVAKNQGASEPEVSYRMLLEELNDGSADVQNAIILNLHGEMVPVPPLRNYSDAARDPDHYETDRVAAGLPGRAWRAVTQPERLWYNITVTAQSQYPGVNVYAYDATPSEMANDTPTTELVDTITLFVPGADTSNLHEIDRIQGNSQTPYYRWITTTANGGFSSYTNGTYTAVTENGANPTNVTYTATFWADKYTPPGRGVTGLRIILYGTTPTARSYAGAGQHPLPY